jgi:CRISPR-associated protein Csd2
MSKTIQNRYEFVYLFDVKDGNPNGDPDAGNMPRVDPETLHGLVTDVSLKRKVRNFVTLAKGGKPPFDIYVREKAVLVEEQEKAYKALGIDLKAKTPEKGSKNGKENKDGNKRSDAEKVSGARKWMCGNFYDVRTFGAVMALKGASAGVVRGPVQMTFARSFDPIMSIEHTITRMAVATREEADKQSGDNRTMGKKHTVPYGLYQAHGFISAFYADATGFDEDDLNLFWQSLINMFDHDRSAARGEMTCRGLYVFKHVSKEPNQAKLGLAPAHKLFDLVKVSLDPGVTEGMARSFDDYKVTVAKPPTGVELIEMA